MPQVTDPALLSELNGGGQQATPNAPGIIRGRPKAPAPVRADVQLGSELSNQQKRASLDEAPLDLRKKEIDVAEAERDFAGGDVVSASEGERKIAGFYARAINGHQTYGSLGVGAPNYLAEVARGTSKDLANLTVNSGPKQRALAAQRSFIEAVLRKDSGAVITPQEEADTARRLFPQVGDDEDTIEQKRLERINELTSLRVGSGRLADEMVERFNNMSEAEQARAKSEQKPLSVDVDAAPQSGAPGETIKRNGVIVGFYGPDGNRVDIDTGPNFDAEGNPVSAEDLNQRAEQRQTELQGKADKLDEGLGQGGLGSRLRQGMTLGFLDEISGVTGGVINTLQGGDFSTGYEDARDVARIRQKGTEERTGLAGDIAEVGGSLALPAGAIRSVGSAAKVGAGYGAAGGFGYGEGAGGSTLNALIGAGGGAVLGAGGQKIGNALAGRMSGKQDLGVRAAELSAAGKAENVTVNRAMVNPALENRVTGSQATLSGGPVVDNALSKVNREIEEGVNRLGAGGTPFDEVSGGNVLANAAERTIDKTGKAASAKYARAEQLAGGATVKPQKSLQTVDDAIAKLSETANTNSAEIKFLQNLKADFGKNLTVGGLRKVRTSLRKKIAKGDLVFGEDEATVLSVMDAAADDIRAGLIAQGKEGAAKAFDGADKAYRARMEYINGTLQKVIGKRNADLPSEQVFKKFMAMSKPGGDSVGLRRFYSTLNPDEAADVSATFAESLGRNNKGDFTTAQFLNQVEKLPEGVRKTVFGVKGAQSIDNLVVLAKEHNRVYGKLNHSRSGVATAARDYRAWLGGAIGLGGPLMGGGASSAIGGAAIASSALAKDYVSARLLMSPNITKWLRNAPKTTSSQAIDRHFNQLGKIAKAEPAIASEINLLQDFILKAANDNPGRAAAEDGKNKNR